MTAIPSNRKPWRIARLTAALAIAATFAGGAMAPASAQTSIRILVNDQPITSYDIQQRTRMVSVFTSGRQGESAAIEQLIDERLMLQEARRVRMEATEADVDTEYAARASQANLTAAQFTQAMRQAGFDPETFRDFLRANLSWTEIVRVRFRATVNISDQDVAAALTGREQAPEEDRTAMEYLLQPIIFVVPQGAGASVAAQQQREAIAFRDAFQGCDQALQQAAGRTGIVVRPPIRREEGQLSAAMRQQLAATEVGGVLGPETVAEGVQLLAMCERNEIVGQTESELEARQELSSERGQLLARRYLRDLRSDAVIEYR